MMAAVNVLATETKIYYNFQTIHNSDLFLRKQNYSKFSIQF